MSCDHSNNRTVAVVERAWDDETRKLIGIFLNVEVQCLNCGAVMEFLPQGDPRALQEAKLLDNGTKIRWPVVFSDKTKPIPDRFDRMPNNN